MVIVLIILIILVAGGFAWGPPGDGPYYVRYGPSGLLGLLLVVLVVLLILGVIPHGL